MNRVLGITNVFRHCLPGRRPKFEHVQGTSSPEFRTRFHRKTSNGSLELGRVGFAPGWLEGNRTRLRASQCKTGIYNMLGGKGQSGGSGPACRAGRKKRRASLDGQPRAAVPK